MEFDISTEKVFCIGASEEKKAVIPLECSIILPDYFPDVMKILRYTAKTVKLPVVSEPSGETVSGNVSIEVCYVSEEGGLCSVSQLRPFSHCFEKTAGIAAAEARVSAGELGCRAVSKRRIDLHGNLGIRLFTLCGEEKRFVSAVENCGAVTKSEETEIIEPLGELYKSFTLEENVPLGEGKPPFGRLISSCAFGEVTECHVIQDKIVTKGEIGLRLLWLPEDSEEGEKEAICSVFSFPVSRMMDASGILMTDICDAEYEAEFPEITPAADGKSIGIKIKTGIFARAYRKGKANYITDLFSTEFETKEEKSRLSVISEAVPLSLCEDFIEKIELPEEASSVIDIWPEPEEPETDSEGDVFLPVKICLLARDAEENPVYFEKKTGKKINSPARGKNTVFRNLSFGIKSSEYTVSDDGRAEVSAKLILDGTAYVSAPAEAVSDCSVNPEKKNPRRFGGITLCYAEKGEKIWDIAKRYRVGISEIAKENKIEGETLGEKRMLVIPG